MKAVLNLIDEFIADIDAVGIAHVQQTWPDLVATYTKFKSFRTHPDLLATPDQFVRALKIQTDDLEFDDPPFASNSGPDGDAGFWVQAWVWIPDD